MSNDVRISGNRIDGGPAPDPDLPRRQLIAEVIALARVIRDAERGNGGEVSGDATLLAYQLIKDERERSEP